MATAYDPKIIQEAADRLYDQARSVIVSSVLVGALIGAGGGYAVIHEFVAAALGAVGLGLVGFLIGRGQAFSLRLQAQTALCQVRIEENTRRPS